jgi:hypothetical protein
VPGEAGYRVKVGTPGVRGKVLQIHLPDHFCRSGVMVYLLGLGLNKLKKVVYTIR